MVYTDPMAEQKSAMRKAAVTPIAPRDLDVLSRRRIEELVSAHGQPAAERMICRHLEEVETAIEASGNAWQRGDRPGLAHAARRLSRLAAFLDLSVIGAVAQNILDLLVTEDVVALAANVGRLQRMALHLGDASDSADGYIR